MKKVVGIIIGGIIAYLIYRYVVKPELEKRRRVMYVPPAPQAPPPIYRELPAIAPMYPGAMIPVAKKPRGWVV